MREHARVEHADPARCVRDMSLQFPQRQAKMLHFEYQALHVCIGALRPPPGKIVQLRGIEWGEDHFGCSDTVWIYSLSRGNIAPSRRKNGDGRAATKTGSRAAAGGLNRSPAFPRVRQPPPPGT